MSTYPPMAHYPPMAPNPPMAPYSSTTPTNEEFTFPPSSITATSADREPVRSLQPEPAKRANSSLSSKDGQAQQQSQQYDLRLLRDLSPMSDLTTSDVQVNVNEDESFPDGRVEPALASGSRPYFMSPPILPKVDLLSDVVGKQVHQNAGTVTWPCGWETVLPTGFVGDVNVMEPVSVNPLLVVCAHLLLGC